MLNSRRIKRRVVLLLTIAAGTPLAIAGDILCGRKLRNRCCVPDHDYSQERFCDPISGSSLRVLKSTSQAPLSTVASESDGVITVPRSADRSRLTMPPGQLRIFQIEPATLRIDHCAVSQVVLTIAESGEWHLSWRAQQTPTLLDEKNRPQFERFRRNEFRLDVRPVLVLTARQTVDEAKLGKPELDVVPRQEFWIQKDEVQRMTANGHADDLRRYFDQIEQVDVHFSYR